MCREILNEERCPGFLLEAVRSAIKKRRRVIKAKMLGIPANDCNSRSVCRTPQTHHRPISEPPLRNLKSLFHLLCTLGKLCLGVKVFQTLHLKIKVSLFGFYSDDEERSSLFGSSEVDGTEVDGVEKPSESRIRNLWVTSQIPAWRLFCLCLLLKDALVRKKEMIQRQTDINVLLLSLFWSH